MRELTKAEIAQVAGCDGGGDFGGGSITTVPADNIVNTPYGPAYVDQTAFAAGSYAYAISQGMNMSAYASSIYSGAFGNDFGDNNNPGPDFETTENDAPDNSGDFA